MVIFQISEATLIFAVALLLYLLAIAACELEEWWGERKAARRAKKGGRI